MSLEDSVGDRLAKLRRGEVIVAKLLGLNRAIGVDLANREDDCGNGLRLSRRFRHFSRG
jgi:hypothetical protein